MEFIRRNNLEQIHVGMKTAPLIDKGARYFIVVVAESPEQRKERVLEIQEKLRVITKNNQGDYLLPIWK